MFANHEGVKAGRDEGGRIYLVIQFTADMIEKVYIDELFEDAADYGELFDIKIEPHVKSRGNPRSFFNEQDPEEISRIKRELNLRPVYVPIRDDLNVFQTLKRMFKEHPPKLAFKAKTIEEHQAWAEELVKIVKKLTAYDLGMVPLEVEEGPETEFKGLILKKIYITTAKHVKAPAILAHPKVMNKPMPGIVCVHGHNKGKINTIGMLESSSDSYYGIELALRGYVTLSLDQWGWGERRGHHKKMEASAEQVFSLSALLLGKTAIGFRCWDV
ncbi:MAG: hypothetical protein ACTSU9_11285, partial [Promethearchaeota archaeon]